MQALNAPTQPADLLFLERLDTFCLAEIKAFAEREQRPFDETRKYVAEWHSKYLFQPQSAENSASPHDRVASVLRDASSILESLCEASGVQSFLLAVDPSDPTGSGFLGGSLLGREFWRGQRGGGDAGAKAFKLHCFKSGARTPAPSTAEASSSKPAPPPAIPKIAPARTLKADLYDGVRKALRSASGVRNAEMKWTNPALLATYGVCLVGWPPTIPAQNPSSLKANQNKELLEALESGTMHFVRTITTRNEPQVDPPPEPLPSAAEEDNSFSWAIQYDDIPDSPATQDSSASDGRGVSDSSFFVWDAGPRPVKRPRVDEN
ncbi:hypothetical protein DFH08DRAFT_838232 [Mycena albidolilacea]|uniref:Uncharacterized protein n=1 Tax=Mycena albidolilacea TaxID=1033008 RepID=A0AAD7ANC6_9AGAR|nr:hypothetical protein DFH08DRAFT_838232 [Mycena albidolilacea]